MISPYLSLLLIALGIGLILLFRARRTAEKKVTAKALEADLTIIADVARAAVWQAFEVDLDLTDDSIKRLDQTIREAWIEPLPMEQLTVQRTLEAAETVRDDGTPRTVQRELVDEEDESLIIHDAFYVFSAYVGTVLSSNHGGAWKSDDEHTLPYVYFKKFDFAVSPFDLMRRKLLAPQHYDLHQEYHNIVWELDQLKQGKSVDKRNSEKEESNEGV